MLEKFTNDELKTLVDNQKVVLFFSASWCPDCIFIDPYIPKLEKEFNDFKWIHVHRDEHMDVAQENNVMGIPSFICFDHGKEVGRFVDKDRKTYDQVKDFLNQVESKL